MCTHEATVSDEASLVARILQGLGDKCCITIIGMAGAGKSTVGRSVAEALGWAHVDSDHLIEATYGVRLQRVTDALDKDGFLDVESRVISSIRMQRTVLSTGGSVVYRTEAMRALSKLGPIVHLDVPLDIILERIARKPDRGLAIAPGQTVKDLFLERELLYRRWATCSVLVDDRPVQVSVGAVLDALATLADKKVLPS
ncbi:MAG: homoserine kinase [Bilophila sp.]